MNDSSFRQSLLLVVVSMGILTLLSTVPWSELTGNTLKDFNLLSDLFPTEKTPQPISELRDPELEGLDDEPLVPDPAETTDNGAESSASAADSLPPIKALAEAPVVDGIVLLESYRPDGATLPNFRSALANVGSRCVRIAMLGDSYIEGDIFAQDLRNLLQERYGGCGVGHVALHSDFPGFRSSVKVSDSGWKLHDVRTMSKNDSIRQLSGDYAVAEGNASTTYKASTKKATTASWSRSSFYFISPDSGTVTLTTDSGAQTFNVTPSADVQCLELPGTTSSFSVRTDVTGLKGLGCRLDPDAGIVLDCMSIRGNSGLSNRKLNATLCRQLAQPADYDLIILEYGMNAVNAEERDYSSYGTGMVKAIGRIKSIYPNADILLLGVGDRGTKEGTAVVSLPTCQAMTNAQRKAAADAGVHFWDTRAAMGGDGAIAVWRQRQLVNADYIHLNHNGGRELGAMLFKAMTRE